PEPFILKHRSVGACPPNVGTAPGLPKALWEARRLHAFALHAGWRENRGHQVVVPFTCDLEMGSGAEFKSLDQIMVHIGIDAGLPERIESCSGRAARNEPGFLIDIRRCVELAG